MADWDFDKSMDIKALVVNIKGRVRNDTLTIRSSGSILGAEIVENERQLGRNNKFDFPTPPGVDLLAKVYVEFGADGAFVSGYVGPFFARHNFREKLI